MTDNTSVLLEKRGQAFWITINRPGSATPSMAMSSPVSPRATAMRMMIAMCV